MSLLDIQNLTAGYRRGTPVLHGVSLAADPGEFVGLVGPNGSGKTTLIRAASRSLPPSAGRVMLEGRDAWEMPSREFARTVAVVPQETAVPFDMTSLEIVLLGRHPHVGRLHLENAADEGVALAALESVNAGPLAGRSVKQISGGERQRVIIAKALAQEPRLLLMDEPTAHLDIAQQTEVMSLVARLARERNMAVVAVLHDLNLAATWCDCVVILHEGRIAANGPPAQVITEPLVARVWQARMWVKRHPATGRPYLLPMPPPYEPEEEEGVISPLIHVVCGGGSGGPVLSALMSQGYRVTCGVVNVGDSDEELCRAMNIPHVAEAPFSPISAESAEANMKMAMAADAIVMTPFCIGPGNLENLRTVNSALQAGKSVVSLAGEDAGSDYTGGEGAALLTQIIARSTPASAEGPMLEALQRVLCD